MNPLKLQPTSQLNIEELLHQHDSDGGNLINESLSKLFSSLNDEENQHEVSIKVAALNQIYSTAIQYIAPVVLKISEEIDNTHTDLSEEQYANLVDKISNVSWISQRTGKHHKRNNLSFCSKYIHFLSKYKLPIYDSYIWIVMVGYLNQKHQKKLGFSVPKNYKDFYSVFTNFRNDFELRKYSNYEIDKYLWQYG
ncbi:MAG: hypothetical protein QNK31_09105, partial [Porticoccus sp.]|nr:hypothetical protein [Porticoccus sp.]